jgi:hypothetical protein
VKPPMPSEGFPLPTIDGECTVKFTLLIRTANDGFERVTATARILPVSPSSTPRLRQLAGTL